MLRTSLLTSVRAASNSLSTSTTPPITAAFTSASSSSSPSSSSSSSSPSSSSSSPPPSTPSTTIATPYQPPKERPTYSNPPVSAVEARTVQHATIRRLTKLTDRFGYQFRFLPNDYVIHATYGIGRFLGLGLRRTGDMGEPVDAFMVEFRDGIVPLPLHPDAEQLTRFADPEASVNVTAYSGVQWHSGLKKIRKTLDGLAERLVANATMATVVGAPPLAITDKPFSTWSPAELARLPPVMQEWIESSDSPHMASQVSLYRAVADSAPFLNPSPDQAKAIAAVEADLARASPMRRLLIGDVGFGKTEVAIRAAAIAILNGRQVAVLTPTHLLGEQHWATFRDRLSTFLPWVSVEYMGKASATTSLRGHAALRRGLKERTVSVAVGANAALSRRETYGDLGLVIVDEEQKYGQAQKELLRDFGSYSHELVLTATPLPATLQAALLGIRDVSWIKAPPTPRLPIITEVAEFDESLVKHILLSEARRGGRSFLVSPRIAFIPGLATTLKKLVPELSVGIVHGSVPPERASMITSAFRAGTIDILLCSHIIDAGLDFPLANTIIVTRAESFGLTQLYQLRGRVGRGSNQSYCYLLTSPDRQPRSARSLETLQSLNSLGDGFQLAAAELDRSKGIGNLLGGDQTGPGKIGGELYQQLLDEAVQSARAKLIIDPKWRAVVLEEATRAKRRVARELAALSQGPDSSSLGDDHDHDHDEDEDDDPSAALRIPGVPDDAGEDSLDVERQVPDQNSSDGDDDDEDDEEEELQGSETVLDDYYKSMFSSPSARNLTSSEEKEEPPLDARRKKTKTGIISDVGWDMTDEEAAALMGRTEGDEERLSLAQISEYDLHAAADDLTGAGVPREELSSFGLFSDDAQGWSMSHLVSRGVEVVAPRGPRVMMDHAYSIGIPLGYVPNPTVRSLLYSAVTTAAVEGPVSRVQDMAAQWTQEFGVLPPPARSLLRTALLNQACIRLGIARLLVEPQQTVLYWMSSFAVEGNLPTPGRDLPIVLENLNEAPRPEWGPLVPDHARGTWDDESAIQWGAGQEFVHLVKDEPLGVGQDEVVDWLINGMGSRVPTSGAVLEFARREKEFNFTYNAAQNGWSERAVMLNTEATLSRMLLLVNSLAKGVGKEPVEDIPSHIPYNQN